MKYRLAFKNALAKGDEKAMEDTDVCLVDALRAIRTIIEGQEDEA